ncbi:MAG: hypothetical protein Alpg2KO_22270 [Alphaproteobacteria bacterium]
MNMADTPNTDDTPRADRKGETGKAPAKKPRKPAARKKASGTDPKVTQKRKPAAKKPASAEKKAAAPKKKAAAPKKTAAAPKKKDAAPTKTAAAPKKKAAAPKKTAAAPKKKAAAPKKTAAAPKKKAPAAKKAAPQRRKATPKKAATARPPVNPDEVLGEPREPRASTMPSDVMTAAPKEEKSGGVRVMTLAELISIAMEAGQELETQTEQAKVEQNKDVTELVTKEELEGLWDAYVDHFGESGELATEYSDARSELQSAAMKLAELRESVPGKDATGNQIGGYKRKLKNAQKKLFEAEDAFFDMREKVAEHYDSQLRQVMEEQLGDHMTQHRDFYAGQISEAEQRLSDAQELKAALEDAQAKGIKELSIPEDADFESISEVLGNAVEANNAARTKKAEQYAKTLLSVKFWTVPDEATGKTLSQDDVVSRRRTLQTLERQDPDLYQQTREAAKAMLENGDYDYQQAVMQTRDEAVEADNSTSAIKRMGADSPKV